MPSRHGQAQKMLQKSMQVRRGQQIFTARDEGDALEGVIDHHGEMVARWRVFACQHDIAKDRGLGGGLTVSEFGEA